MRESEGPLPSHRKWNLSLSCVKTTPAKAPALTSSNRGRMAICLRVLSNSELGVTCNRSEAKRIPSNTKSRAQLESIGQLRTFASFNQGRNTPPISSAVTA